MKPLRGLRGVLGEGEEELSDFSGRRRSEGRLGSGGRGGGLRDKETAATAAE